MRLVVRTAVDIGTLFLSAMKSPGKSQVPAHVIRGILAVLLVSPLVVGDGMKPVFRYVLIKPNSVQLRNIIHKLKVV